MFWIVSNYSLWAMEKTNFCILLFIVLLTSLCNSQYDYTYDDYENDEYNYNEYYDYNNQKSEDYTDDYSQELNYYYDQNLLTPPNPPPLPPIPPPIPPPLPPPPMGKITFFSILNTMMKYKTSKGFEQ